ncbi:MAG TPA: hypothetical protein VD886_08665 [Herpetosiphonaceae bacterium]|nr:hypothetical protein [Herpetosiphonaceae bacterium]
MRGRPKTRNAIIAALLAIATLIGAWIILTDRPTYIALDAHPLDARFISETRILVVTANHILMVDGDEVVSSVRPPGFAADSATISPDGRMAVTTSPQGGMELWSLETRQRIFKLAYATNIIDVSWTPTSDYVALLYHGPMRQSVILLGLNPLRIQRMLALPHGDPPNRLALSPDRAWVALSYYERSTTIVRLSDGTRLADLTPPPGRDSALTWSDDGTVLLSGGHVWKRDHDRLVYQKRLSGPSDVVTASAFQPKTACAALIGGWSPEEPGRESRDRTIYIWDLASTTLLATLAGQESAGPAYPSHGLNRLRINPSGTRLVSIDGQGLRLWRLKH